MNTIVITNAKDITISTTDGKNIFIKSADEIRLNRNDINKITLSEKDVKINEDTRIYECKTCNKLFSSREFLRKHIKNKRHQRSRYVSPLPSITPSPLKNRSHPGSRSPSPTLVEKRTYNNNLQLILKPHPIAISNKIRCTVRIYNLALSVTEKDIRDLFESFGWINLKIEMIKGEITNKCFVLVDQKLVDDIVLKLGGREFDDRQIQVYTS